MNNPSVTRKNLLEVFSKRLKDSVYQRDISYVELEKILGLGKSSISNYISGENWYGKRHTLVLDALGLHNGDYTMYSWKDTGACDLYLATKDIMFVKDMCRHSTVAFTEIYLRGMGILLNNTSSGNAPKLSI